MEGFLEVGGRWLRTTEWLEVDRRRRRAEFESMKRGKKRGGGGRAKGRQRNRDGDEEGWWSRINPFA